MNKEIASRIAKKMSENKKLNDLWFAIDDIDKLKWQLPRALSAKDWARIDIDTSGHDALKVASNIFSRYLPKWDVQPSSPLDAKRSEELERWIEWQVKMMDDRTGSLVWDVMKSAVTYDVCVAQVEYLPYWLPKDRKSWTARQKKYMRGGPFVTTVRHPSSVYWERTQYGLEWITVAENSPAAEIRNYWIAYANDDTDEGKKIKIAVRKLEDLCKEDKDARVDYFDYTDYDKRYVYFYPSKKLDENAGEGRTDMVTVVDTENTLGFIPWVVSVGGTSYEPDPEYKVDPMIGSLHRSNSWSNQNLYESLQTSSALKSYGLPDMIVQTPTKQSVEVDYTGDVDQIVTGPGESAQPYPKQPLDPRMREIIDRGRARMNANMGIQGLQLTDVKGNMQFATLNAQYQMGLAALAKPKRVAEQAFSQMGMLMFEWLDFTEDTVTGFRVVDQGENNLDKRGAPIEMNVDRFTLDKLYISVEMLPNNPTDRMQRMNLAVLGNQQLKLPLSEVHQSLGLKMPSDVLISKWQAEQIEDAALAQMIELQRMQAMQALQAQQGAMQGGAQGIPNQPGQMGQGQGVNTPANDMAAGQGFDTSQGGTPRQEINPTGQVAANGQTVNGDEIV